MKPPATKLPWSVSFPSIINALSIPLIAGLLLWTLNRVLTPSDWCPALEEFKSQAAALAALRCQPILIAQLDIGKFTAVGLVGALSLSHLVSVVREAKAGLELSTKLGSLKLGGDDAKAGARHVKEAADEAAAEVTGAEPAPQWPVEPRPTTREGELP